MDIIPEQEDIKKGSIAEQKKRLTFEELKEKLAKEKGGVGSTNMPTSVPESDKIKSETP